MFITITQKHLDQAIVETLAGKDKRTRTCLVAQAAKELFGKEFAASAADFIRLEGRLWHQAKEIGKLTYRFDDAISEEFGVDEKRMAAVRAILPFTIDIGEAKPMDN